MPLVAKKPQETDEKNCIAFIGDVFTEDTNIQLFCKSKSKLNVYTYQNCRSEIPKETYWSEF